jgi:hypothetical protein
MRALAVVLAFPLVVALAGCMPPPGPFERLTYTAHETGTALRFGRLDLALALVRAEVQQEFAVRHARWGRDVRIVDLEVTGVRMFTEEEAEVQLAVSWHRLSETTVRTSGILQRWNRIKGDDWRIAGVMPAGGSPGLLADPPPDRTRPGADERGPSVDLGQL